MLWAILSFIVYYLVLYVGVDLYFLETITGKELGYLCLVVLLLMIVTLRLYGKVVDR